MRYLLFLTNYYFQYYFRIIHVKEEDHFKKNNLTHFYSMIFFDILLNDLITRLNELDSVDVHVIFMDKL